MKYILLPAVLVAGTVLAPGARAEPSSLPIPAALAADGRFQTLVTALEKAGLDDALRSGGPFTVFAPTDEAFGRLPEGAIDALLEPAGRSRLWAILTYHVVAGRVSSSSLLPTPAATSLYGPPIPLGLRVGPANVIEADRECANGIIHVIDAVLLPPGPDEPTAEEAVKIIADAIQRGVPLYNAGDHEACARIYDDAARRVLALGQAVPEMDRMDLEAARQAAAHGPDDRAWSLRHAFDRILMNQAFEPRMEASLPEGFPGPGPVGRVVLKSYPRYRAARTEGSQSFWTLFRHIKRNDVQMTAPVEMTVDENLRERDMAFLYERADQGEPGAQGRVQVLDLEPVEVLSVGVRGARSMEMVERARRVIEARLAADGLEPAGDWRLFGYNSPMVPVAHRFWELQLPVTRRGAD